MGVWSCLWGNVSISDWCGRVQSIISSAIPKHSPSSTARLAEGESHKQRAIQREGAKQLSSVFSASVLARSPALTSLMIDYNLEVKDQRTSSPTPPYLHPQHSCFGLECFIIATEINQNRTKCFPWAFKDSYQAVATSTAFSRLWLLSSSASRGAGPDTAAQGSPQTTINLQRAVCRLYLSLTYFFVTGLLSFSPCTFLS